MAVLMKNPQSFEKNPVSRRRFYIPRGNVKLAALLEMPKNNRKGTLPFFSEISLLGHSQGGVVASMTAGN